MRRRMWKTWARTAMAITVSVAAFAAGGALALTGPAGAVGTTGRTDSSVIDVTNGDFKVILSNSKVARLAAADQITAFHGFSSLQNLVIQSQGFDLEGRIQGTLRTYDFKSLWTVYNLPSSSGWKVWALSFKKDTSQSVLKETFRSEQLIDVNIDIKFKVSAAALNGVSTLRIGFETLRLQLDGTTKDFTVVNGASGGAKDQNNGDVPVDFEEL
ncbi:hypothetical protein [Actinoplanes sp. L3-i22]|uniref:hypothetical protein n=1 Tax=Actinoplanes sp. L3-i22 TaxID=2836373 RepID=UPI001C753708|nr:hypothetical protein [Actinoplanes sp. L3-i22]BCY13376.1 hypothetical protein L3i22_084640 [Actinoplanes sp. L3-i22]